MFKYNIWETQLTLTQNHISEPGANYVAGCYGLEVSSGSYHEARTPISQRYKTC